MDLVKLATSRLGPAIATTLANTLPQPAAYRLADGLAGILSSKKDRPLTQSLAKNMSLVMALPEDAQEVQDAVSRLMRNQLRSYVDLYRAIKAGRDALQSACALDEESERALEEGLDEQRGLLLVGTHSCSFDMLLMALPKLAPSVQALTKAEPEGSTNVVNELRREFGVEITPISKSALKQAIKRLKSGGVVAIAADLPQEDGELLDFLGHTFEMTTGHARLALQTGAQMVVCTSYRTGPGQYRAKAVLVDQPESTGDRAQDALTWAQEALVVTESFIRERPDEWFMPQEFQSGTAERDQPPSLVTAGVPSSQQPALTSSRIGG
jgi:lauroyl/myristoyl acyltransferase